MIQVNDNTAINFKDTLIGPIPAEWEICRLSEIAAVKYGKAKPHGQGDIPVLGSSGIYTWVDKPLVDYPTIVIGRKGSAGQVWLTKTPSWIADTAFFLEWRTNVNIEYLAAYLHLHKLSGEHAKTTMPSLQKQDLENLLVALPPSPEQLRIAAVLNTIQNEITAQDDLINETREFKRSLMQQLFTYGAGEQPAETKETEIGEIPGHWEVKQLGDVVQSTQYGLSERAEETGKYPMLRMNSLVDGRIDTRDLKFIDLDENSFKKFRLRPGDILFNRTNSLELVGKTSIFDIADHFVFASYLVRVITKADILLPGYLNFYLNTDQAQARLKMLATRGVSQSNINAAKLRLFKIPVPPSLEEQREIATQLDIVDTKIAAEEDRKAALQDFFKTMLHQLMTGQIRLLSDDGLPL